MEIYYVSKQDNKVKYVVAFTPKSITTRHKMLRAMGHNVAENNTHLAVLAFDNDDNTYPIQEFKASCNFIKSVTIFTYLILLCSWASEVAFCLNGLMVLVSTFFLQKEESRVRQFNFSNLSYH